MLRFCTQGGKASLDLQPHWVSSLAWPEEEAGSLWGGEPRELLLVGRMDGTLGLLEVLDDSDMQRTELQHCFRKDGTDSFYETQNKITFGDCFMLVSMFVALLCSGCDADRMVQ